MRNMLFILLCAIFISSCEVYEVPEIEDIKEYNEQQIIFFDRNQKTTLIDTIVDYHEDKIEIVFPYKVNYVGFRIVDGFIVSKYSNQNTEHCKTDRRTIYINPQIARSEDDKLRTELNHYLYEKVR